MPDGIYVTRYDNNLLVKRLQMLPGGIIRVKSDNSMYDPWRSQSRNWTVKNWRLSGVWFRLGKRCDLNSRYKEFQRLEVFILGDNSIILIT